MNQIYNVFAEFLRKPFEEKDFMKIFIKTFSSKNLPKRSTFIFFKRSSNNFFLKSFVKWSKLVGIYSEDLFIKSSGNLLIDLQKIFLRSHVDLRKIFKEDLLKILKRTRDEIFLLSRRR